jgi:mRNA interferase MazF
MERLVKGDVVVLPFPFSDLSQSKKRPAFVVAPLQGDDVILCQITTVIHSDLYSILLEEKDFVTGSLKQPSYIRPNRLFTSDIRIIIKRVGSVHQNKIEEVIKKITMIITGPSVESGLNS